MHNFMCLSSTAHAERNTGNKGAHKDVEVIEAGALLIADECSVPLFTLHPQFTLGPVHFPVQVTLRLQRKITDALELVVFVARRLLHQRRAFIFGPVALLDF